MFFFDEIESYVNLVHRFVAGLWSACDPRDPIGRLLRVPTHLLAYPRFDKNISLAFCPFWGKSLIRLYFVGFDSIRSL